MKIDDLLQPDRTPCYATDVAGDPGLIEPRIRYAHAGRADAGTSHAPIADGPGLVEARIARADAGRPDATVARRTRLVEAGVAGAGSGRPDAAVARRAGLVDAGIPRFRDDGKVRHHRSD
jgi:hypothetical protein